MTTIEFILKELKKSEINLKHADKKPNISDTEYACLHEKYQHWKIIYHKFTGKRWNDGGI